MTLYLKSHCTEWVTTAAVSYFNAGVDGADEEDVGEDDEDANVKT